MSIQVQHRRDTNANIEAVTPAVGELGMDTTKKEALIGDGATAGGVRLAKKNIIEIQIAAQISANTNDYDPANQKHARKLILSSDAARDLTGIVPRSPGDTTDGRELTLYNGGSFNITLRDQSASSSAANRFDLGGADITLQPKASVTLRYRTQGALNRWELDASTAGAAVATGAVLARTLAASSLAFVGMINGTIVPSVAGGALTIALKTLAGADPSGSDPVLMIFRDVTAAAGDYIVRTITSARSLAISSGSSMGIAANNTAFRLWVTGHDDGTTGQLGAINCLSGSDIFPLAGWGIASTTAEGGAGAADNAQTFYTASALASKPYIPLAYMNWESGLAAAGTWSAAPTRVQLFGHGVPLPGQVVGGARLATGASATGTTTVPFDDTIPQNTEGDQYMTKAYTPSSGANIARVRTKFCYSMSAVTFCVVSLFQDSGANALASATKTIASADYSVTEELEHKLLFNLTISTTFKVRAGPTAAATLTFNGRSGSRLFGGVENSYLDIEELMA